MQAIWCGLGCEEESSRVVPVAWLATHKCPHYRTLGGTPCDDCVPQDIEAHRQCEQYRAPIHPDIAALLEMESSALMLVRRIKLFMHDKPVLTAISFVPYEMFGEPGDAWKEVAVDNLAVAGGHTLIPWGYTATLNGLPAVADCVKHGCPLDTEPSVTLYAKPYWVWIENDKERERRAGLVLLVRRDRVRLERHRQYPRLLLRRKFLRSLGLDVEVSGRTGMATGGVAIPLIVEGEPAQIEHGVGEVSLGGEPDPYGA